MLKQLIAGTRKNLLGEAVLVSPENLRFHNEAVLTSTHNPCFGAKIRKIGMPRHTPVLLLKSGV